MKKIRINEKKVSLLILCLVCTGYVLFLFQFYNIDYFVPDFGSYNGFAFGNRKAADGFSSLFIWMASLCNIMPKFMTFFCLAMLAFSIFNILFFYYDIFWESTQKFVLVMVMCMSSGVWYYFYGKVFYDVPFSVYNYSLCLLVFAKLYKMEKTEDRKKVQLWWYILAYLLGLMMSWKPYNIFMLAGLGLLALAYDETREIIYTLLNSLKKIIVLGFFLLLGYITGNFNILLFPRETIDGIKAYSASYIFSEFMLDKHRIIWDHINDLPFSLSVFSIVFLIFTGIVWPIIIKKLRYLWISLFMFGALAIYVSYFSPGLTWHGFSYGIYYITYILILVKETKSEVLYSGKFKILLVFAITIQCGVNFGYYIPTQVRWAETTRESIDVLENRETEIFKHVTELIESFGESTYVVDNAVKRYRPYYKTALDFRPVSMEQPYIMAENITFVDPLKYMDFESWNNICMKEGLGNSDCDYIIYIMPNVFKSMGDVADIHLYDEKELLRMIKEADYTIYVYDNLKE